MCVCVNASYTCVTKPFVHKEQTPAEKKAEAFLAKERSKADAQWKAAQVRAATNIATKLDPIVASLTTVVGHTNFGMIAAPMATPLQDTMKDFTELKLACQAAMVGDHDESNPIPDAKKVQAQIALVKKHLAVVGPMLSNMGTLPPLRR